MKRSKLVPPLVVYDRLNELKKESLQAHPNRLLRALFVKQLLKPKATWPAPGAMDQ